MLATATPATPAPVMLFESQDYPGMFMFHCERLHSDLAPFSCAKNYASPRQDCCVSCSVGKQHFEEANGAVKEATGAGSFSADGGSISRSSVIAENLLKRRAFEENGGTYAPLSCIRCDATAATNKRLVGRLRLILNRTICVSCFNRQREILTGKNAKGETPKLLAGKLHPTILVFENGDDEQEVDIGLSTGHEEAKRYAQRVHPRRVLVDVILGAAIIPPEINPTHAAKPYGAPKKRTPRTKASASRHTYSAHDDDAQAQDELLPVAPAALNWAPSRTPAPTSEPVVNPDIEPEPEVEPISARVAAPTPRKLAVGARIGKLTLQREGKRQMWVCLCDCGRKFDVHAQSLRGGQVTSCGCAKREKPTPHQAPAGQQKPAHVAVRPGVQIGYWTAIQPVRGSLWRWKCTCETVRTIDAATIKTGPRSCGCGGGQKPAKANEPSSPEPAINWSATAWTAALAEIS